MLKLLMMFSIIAVSGCASKPVKPAPFNSHFVFYDAAPGEYPMACLPKKDVEDLRKILIRCEKK